MNTIMLERPTGRPTRRRGDSFADYQAIKAVNWSTLGAMHTSALEYHEALTNPKRPTPTMVLGSAIHLAILEPELFEATYAMYDGRLGTKAYEEWQGEHPGLSALKPEQWEQCMGAAWAVHRGRQGREARRIMRGSKREVTLRWIDPDTHIRCKARPDIVRYTRESDGSIGPWILADVKTTTSVDERKFGRLAGDMLYHCKMAFARMGLEAIHGYLPHRVTIIAVEQSPPHDVGVFDISKGDLERSEDEVCGLLQKLKRCRKTRTWPGRCENPQVLDLAPWLFPSDSDYTDTTIEVISS